MDKSLQISSNESLSYLVNDTRFEFVEWFRVQFSVQTFILIHAALWRCHCIQRLDHALEGDIRLLSGILRRRMTVFKLNEGEECA